MSTSAPFKPAFAMLVALSALSVLSLNMFLPSLPAMADDLDTDYATISIAIAGYLAITAVLQVIIGPLSDLYGRRPVLLKSLLIFTVASVGCYFADDLTTFLICRMFQGVITAGWTTSMAMIRDTEEPRRAAGLMGYVAMAMAVAPMMGPIIGGQLDQAFGWRAAFLAYAGCGAVLFVWCALTLRETNQSRAATLGAQLRAYPLLLKAPAFWGYAGCLTFSIASFYAFLAGAPLVTATAFNMSPATLGIGLGSITGGFLLGSFLSGRLSPRTSLTVMMLAGRITACMGVTAGLVVIAVVGLTPYTFFGATVFIGIGNGLTTPSASAGAMSVRPELAGSASGLSGAMIVANGALFTALTGYALTAAPRAELLLGVMLACAVIALIAAIFTHRFERAE